MSVRQFIWKVTPETPRMRTECISRHVLSGATGAQSPRGLWVSGDSRPTQLTAAPEGVNRSPTSWASPAWVRRCSQLHGKPSGRDAAGCRLAGSEGPDQGDAGQRVCSGHVHVLPPQVSTPLSCAEAGWPEDSCFTDREGPGFWDYAPTAVTLLAFGCLGFLLRTGSKRLRASVQVGPWLPPA